MIYTVKQANIIKQIKQLRKLRRSIEKVNCPPFSAAEVLQSKFIREIEVSIEKAITTEIEEAGDE